MGCCQAVRFPLLFLMTFPFPNSPPDARDTSVPSGRMNQVPSTVLTESGVTVGIAISQDASRRAWIIGTFTPDDSGFHLYSKDLPRTGIRGLGRPTRLDVVRSKSIATDGPLVANQPVRTLREEGLGQTLRVYPDGPVTLRQPVRLSVNASDSATLVTLSITYMACSKRVCLPPVVGRQVEVAIPRADRH
jgi:hypothetical protein